MKIFKDKFSTTLMIIIMIQFLLQGTSFFGYFARAATLEEETFYLGVEGQAPSGWNILTSNPISTDYKVAIDEDGGVNATKGLQIVDKDGNTSTYTKVWKTFWTWDSINTFEVDMKFGGSSGSAFGSLSIYDANNAHLITSVRFDSGSGLRTYNGTTVVNALSSAQQNTWYNIKCVINASTKKLDIYIDNQQTNSQLDFYDNSATAARSIVFAASETTAAGVCVDNFRAYTGVPTTPQADPTPSPVDLAIYDNFNTSGISEIPENWQLELSSPVSVNYTFDVRNAGTKNSNCARLYENDSNSNSYVSAKKSFAQQTSGIITAQADVKFAGAGSFSIIDSSYLKLVANIRYDSGGYGIRTYDGTSAVAAYTYATENVWYNLKIIIDMNTKKYNLYINNQLTNKDLSFYDSTAANIGYVRFGTKETGENGLLFDNVKICNTLTDQIENFNIGQAGTMPYDWSLDLGTPATTSYSATIDASSGPSGDNSLKLTENDSNSATSLKARKTIHAISTNSEVEIQIKFGGTPAVNFQIIDSTNTKVIAIIRYDNGCGFRSYDGTTPVNSLSNAQSNTWYKVKFVNDITAKKYDVYINDELTNQGLNFVNNTATNVGIIQLAAVETSVNAIYFDELKITPIPNVSTINFEGGGQVNSATNVSVIPKNIVVAFDDDVNLEYLKEANFELKNLSNNQLVRLDVVSKKSKECTLKVAETLESATQYQFKVIGNIISLNNTKMTSDYTVSFTTGNASKYYVSPNGNDNYSGTEAQPFATLSKARQAVRTAISGGMSADMIVYFRGGDYYMSSTVTFDEADSGKSGYSIVYKNYPNEEPVFHGGEKVTGWQLDSGNIYKATVGTSWTFSTLYENGTMSKLARYPNTGYSTAVADNPLSTTKFKYNNNDVPNVSKINELSVHIWPGGPNGIYNYFTNDINVTSVDYANKLVTLSTAAWYQIGTGSRYFVQGNKEFLDAPGEFYLDKTTGVLYYYPISTSPINELTIVAPKATTVIKMVGGSASNIIKNIRFEGLSISDTDKGMHGILIYNAENISVKDCKIFNIGEYAVYISGYSKYININGNLIYDIGNTGVQINGSTKTINNYICGSNTISNNYIHDIGRLVGQGAGIYIFQSPYNVVSYNRINNTPRHSIALGSSASQTLIGQVIDGVTITNDNIDNYYISQDNIIEFNDVSNANCDSQDTAPIATYMTGKNNVISNNSIHDSGVPFSFGFGIYLDAGSDYFTVKNNLIYNMQNYIGGTLYSPLFIKGVKNKVYNNIIANSNTDKAFTTLVEEVNCYGERNYAEKYNNREIEMSRNIFYNSGGNIYDFSYKWYENMLKKSDKNTYYDTSGSYALTGIGTPTTSYTTWKSLQNNKYDNNSITSNPIFMNQSNNDFRLRYDSPSYGLGFVDINIQEIGLKSNFKFADTSEPISAVFTKEIGGNVNSANIRLFMNQTARLQTMARTENGFVADLANASISYESNNTGVATVNSAGVITAVSSGTAKITVSVTKDSVTKYSDVYVIVNS